LSPEKGDEKKFNALACRINLSLAYPLLIWFNFEFQQPPASFTGGFFMILVQAYPA
jgi:hypothetical protein